MALAVLSKALALPTLLSSSPDMRLLIASRFVRLFAYGLSTLVLVQFLSGLGISDARVGLFMTLTLLGDVVISFLLTIFADGLGRRRVLVLGAGLMVGSGIVFSWASDWWWLLAASVLGVISPSGNEIGPFRAVEESTLAQLTPKEARSDIFAWYTLFGTAGAALGTITCGWLVAALEGMEGWTPTSAHRVVYALYAVIGLFKLGLALMLTSACEPEPIQPQRRGEEEEQQEEAWELLEGDGLLSDDRDHEPDDGRAKSFEPAKDGFPGTPKELEADKVRPPPGPRPERSVAPRLAAPAPIRAARSLLPRISRASLDILLQLCALFALDSLASGLVPSSWMTYYFSTTYAISPSMLGTLFFTTNLVASVSALFAAALARSIGPLRTMVFTHLPSAFFLALIPAPGKAWGSMAFLVARSCTASMDQAPRQAFLSMAVLPSERTAVMGVVNVVKTASQGLGMGATGLVVQAGKFWAVFVLAGAMKASYDLGLLWLFLGFKGRENADAGADGDSGAERERRARGSRG